MSLSFSTKRFWFINSAVLILFVIVTYQAVQLTVIRRSALIDEARKQHNVNIEIPPLRGDIVDRNGRELAVNLKQPSLYAVPRMLSKSEKVSLAAKLAAILALQKEYVYDRLDRDKAFIWIKRKIAAEELAAVNTLNHPALGIVEEYRRFYPQGTLLSQIIGFTNIDNRGLEGIELALENELRGQKGKRYTKRDALGREIRAFDLKTIPAIDGQRVVLTIDQYLQYLTEKALDKAFQKWNAIGATAIIMDPHTGEILAMANRPSYNPNKFSSSSADDRRNRAITDAFEPGSIFKAITASSVLNEGAASLSDVFFCENGEYNYGTRTLRDVHAYGNLSFAEVIIKSSNIGTVKMAAKLKPEVFQSYIEAFGFGSKTGIDFPGEVSGFTNPPSRWSSTSPYNIPMGHEILVTALQMVRAYSAIANGGEMMRPYIVSKITDQQGVVLKENKPAVENRVIREEVAATMRTILTRVVEEGTGKNARIEGIPVGGKTGTAQKVLPNGGGYSHSNFIASFVGIAPTDNPRLVMGVMIDDPHPKYYGGTVAAPVFKEVIEAALIYLGYVPNAGTDIVSGANLPESQENQPMLPSVVPAGRAL